MLIKGERFISEFRGATADRNLQRRSAAREIDDLISAGIDREDHATRSR